MTSRAGIAFLLFCIAGYGPGCSEESELSKSTEQQTNAPVLIEPSVSVGKVHAGMTVAELKQILGPPQRTTPNSIQYPKLGFAVMPDAEGIIQVVMCGDVTGLGGPYTKAFAGRTKEGIGMLSTREQVVSAFGEPDTSERFMGGLESMKYSALGITLTLERGKVFHMIVRLGRQAQTPPPPDNAVTIELNPRKK
jgi:hypothetical protein